MFGTPTVKSVFTKFTAELNKVVTSQQTVADTAFNAKIDFQTKAEAAKTKELAALAEVTSASNAITKIGELLGVDQS